MTSHRSTAALLVLLAAPLPATGQQPLVSPQGELRLRWEADHHEGEETRSLTLLRARLGVDARLGSAARVFLQVQDSRTFGEEASTLDGAADALDMHQAWLEMAWAAADVSLAARAGRQEIALGSERLLGAVGWSNVGRSFDALRLTAAPASGRWSVSAFAATLAERGGSSGASRGEADHTLLGLWAEGALLDGFLIHEAGARYRAFEGVDRSTFGGRIDLPGAWPVQASLEGTLQLGNQVLAGAVPLAQDVSAGMVGVRVWRPAAGTLRSLGVGVDWLSGDPDPSDDEYRAFHTLYATNHKFYGYLDLFTDPAAQTGDRGLVDAMLNARVAATGALVVEADLHGFWFAEARTDEERLIGHELDLTLPIALPGGPRLALGYSGFRAGAGAAQVGLGEEGDFRHWGYVQATVAFEGPAPGR